MVKLLWCVRDHKVVTLTVLKFLLVPVLSGRGGVGVDSHSREKNCQREEKWDNGEKKTAIHLITLKKDLNIFQNGWIKMERKSLPREVKCKIMKY